MKIALFTSQDVGPKLVKFFFEKHGVELLVITQETDRDLIYGYASTKEACNSLGVRWLSPSKIDEDFIATVSDFGPDIIISAYYPKIFPKKLISIPRLGSVNVHPGALPLYRGRFAIPWSILNGENEITVSMHYIEDKVDSGAVIASSKFDILPCETGFELYLRAMHEAGNLLITKFDDLVSGVLRGIPQSGFGSYYTHLDPRYHINWQDKGEVIERQVRVHAPPYLPAFFYLINHCIYVKKVSFIKPENLSANSVGVVIDVLPSGKLWVSCADGVIQIDEFDLYPHLDETSFKKYIRIGSKLE